MFSQFDAYLWRFINQLKRTLWLSLRAVANLKEH